MTDIATAIYDLVGHLPIDPTATSEEDRIKEKVDRIFQVRRIFSILQHNLNKTTIA